MRIGVIRGDLPGSLFLSDLEPTSQENPSLGKGQTRYLARPSLTALNAYFAAQGLTVNAANLVLATVPVGGPVDVSSATIKGVTGLASATNTQVTAIQDLLAPRFAETSVVNASFTSGNISKLRNASFTPDPNRFNTGAAIAVVEDDGVTTYAP